MDEDEEPVLFITEKEASLHVLEQQLDDLERAVELINTRLLSANPTVGKRLQNSKIAHQSRARRLFAAMKRKKGEDLTDSHSIFNKVSFGGGKLRRVDFPVTVKEFQETSLSEQRRADFKRIAALEEKMKMNSIATASSTWTCSMCHQTNSNALTRCADCNSVNKSPGNIASHAISTHTQPHNQHGLKEVERTAVKAPACGTPVAATSWVCSMCFQINCDADSRCKDCKNIKPCPPNGPSSKPPHINNKPNNLLDNKSNVKAYPVGNIPNVKAQPSDISSNMNYLNVVTDKGGGVKSTGGVKSSGISGVDKHRKSVGLDMETQSEREVVVWLESHNLGGEFVNTVKKWHINKMGDFMTLTPQCYDALSRCLNPSRKDRFDTALSILRSMNTQASPKDHVNAGLRKPLTRHAADQGNKKVDVDDGEQEHAAMVRKQQDELRRRKEIEERHHQEQLNIKKAEKEKEEVKKKKEEVVMKARHAHEIALLQRQVALAEKQKLPPHPPPQGCDKPLYPPAGPVGDKKARPVAKQPNPPVNNSPVSQNTRGKKASKPPMLNHGPMKF